ncbi:MAG: protein kinase [Blastocatellia bacterium]|nr:protein kinase [Blastocatellia bacterium]
MTQEQWKQVKLLFEEVIKLDPSQEKTYLDNNCKDEIVRKEVESLLDSHKKAEGFLPEIERSTQSVRAEHKVESYNDFSGTARFLIQKRLGAGGFGVVYQAYDQERNSVVALKTLHKVTDAEDLYRFKKEFRSLTDIVHPNLAAMYELFLEKGQWFFTMEMIYGKNFLEYVTAQITTSKVSSSELKTATVADLSLSKKNITQAEMLNNTSNQISLSNSSSQETEYCKADIPKLRSVLKQLTKGLIALHKANKLHRDLKPSNVLVTKEGRVVILDFGLVSELTKQGVNQITGDSILGTPAYMSPEHIAGLAISPASDWYSVGTMLYLALTGKLPFNGNQMEVMLNKQRHEARSPSDLVLGIPKDLDSLCQDLLQRNVKLRPTGEEILRFLGDKDDIAISVSNLTIQSMPFVGREQELKVLNEAWQQTKQGNGVSVYLSGYSGIGKSTIVKHFLQNLEQREPDLLVFSARCYEQEFVAYKALDSVIDLLSKYLKGLSSLAVEALLPLDVMALARLFPVLRQVGAIANFKRNLQDTPDPKELRRKAFVALRELFIRLANKKDIVIVIDDLQWGDLDSAVLLAEILRPPDAPRFLLIGCYRKEEADNSLFLRSLFSLQNDFDEKAKIQEITVDALPKESAKQLAISLLGEESALKQAEIIVKESGGNPFFINELTQYSLAKSLKQEINPDEMKIDKVINARIAQLSTDGRRLLEIVAVSGQPLTRIVAKRAAEISADEQLLPLLRANHLLRSTGNTYEEIDTYHDKIREAIISNLSSGVLQKYHHLLALALEETKTDDPERLAKHFQLAGEQEKACTYTITAAQKADEALAFDRAVQLYQQTLNLNSTPSLNTVSVKVKLGKALANLGKGVDSARAYLAATADSDRQGILELQHRAAEQFLNAGYIEEGVGLLKEVLSKVGMKLTSTQTQALLSILIGRVKLWLRGMKYQKRVESEIPAEQLKKVDVCWTVVDSIGNVNPLEALNFQTKHILLALEMGEPYRLVRAMTFECFFSGFSGTRAKAKTAKLIEMTTNLAKEVNKPELLAMVSFITGGIAYMEGDWKKALDFFKIGEEITETQCLNENYAFALRGIDVMIVFLLRTLFHLGNINDFLLKLLEKLKDAESRNNLLVSTNLKSFAVYIKYLVADEPEKAYKELKEMTDLWTKRGFHIQYYWKMVAYTEISLYLGKGKVAWDYLAAEWPKLKKSMMLKTQRVLVESLQLQARVALAATRDLSNNSYLFLAEKNAKRILKEKTLSGDAWAELILASVALAKGSVKLALNYLNEAEKKFTSADMMLYLAVTQYRRGQLLANTEGNKLIEQADKWMRSQKIKNPKQILDMLAPGNWA